MKLRVALCAAVLVPGAAAFAQSHPWLLGPYDKLQPHDARARPFPDVVNNVKIVCPKGGGAVVFVPASGRPATSQPKLILPTNRSETFSYRANYFRLPTAKSDPK